jgi:MFS family permease
VLPDIKRAVDASDGAFGLALLGVGIGALPAMLAMGAIYDRFGDRTVAPILVVFGLSTMLPGAAPSVSWLFATLLAVGALSGLLDVAIDTAAVQWEADTSRRLLNLLHAAFSGFFLVASISVGPRTERRCRPMAVLVSLAIVAVLTRSFLAHASDRRMEEERTG